MSGYPQDTEAGQASNSSEQGQLDSVEAQVYQQDLVSTLASEFLSYSTGNSGGSSESTPTASSQTPSPYQG